MIGCLDMKNAPLVCNADTGDAFCADLLGGCRAAKDGGVWSGTQGTGPCVQRKGPYQKAAMDLGDFAKLPALALSRFRFNGYYLSRDGTPVAMNDTFSVTDNDIQCNQFSGN